MVTEFAEYGSLHDLMNKMSGNKPRLMMRTKICLDASKGIEYLHDNGILHRDIKPDNMLIISLEDNMNVNAKLTDFGSARNVNLLITNMTFTKGIGTPVYMAPEVLDQQHYKKPADIYSFAITMFECFGWEECYPKSEFKFPWKIAEFVSSGHRMRKKHEISDDEYDLIEKCWCQNPNDRLEIKEIIKKLEELYGK